MVQYSHDRPVSAEGFGKVRVGTWKGKIENHRNMVVKINLQFPVLITN